MTAPRTTADHVAEILDRGYTVLPDAVPDDLRVAVLAAVDRSMAALEIPFGANHFLGHRTRRLFNLLGRDPLFATVPLFEPVLDIATGVLDDGLLLSSLTAIETNPGQPAQPLHADTGSIPLRRPHQPIGCTAIWALTDFTLANGATRFVPGSHHRDRIPTKGEVDPDEVQATMPAGSVVLYDGAVWHAGGANDSDGRRVGIVVNHCAGWVRQEENQLLANDRAQVETYPPRLRRMLGYGTYRGLIGHVDQVDPATWFDDDAQTRMVWASMR